MKLKNHHAESYLRFLLDFLPCFLAEVADDQKLDGVVHETVLKNMTAQINYYHNNYNHIVQI